MAVPQQSPLLELGGAEGILGSKISFATAR